MKAISIFSFICCLAISALCQAQTEEGPRTDTVKRIYLLDEQTRMFGQIFEMGGAGEDNPVGDVTNYSELIENSDLTEEQKETVLEQYQVYDLSLDPTKTDSLKIAVEKMLNKAIEKSQTEIDTP